jgi:hypothetical protein
MTKRFTTVSLVLLGLFVSMPALAQSQPAYDDFEVTLTILPPVTNEVQVLGMDDIAFGPITLGSSDTILPAQTDHFCLNRTTPGNVLVTFEQLTDADSGPGFRMAKESADYLPFAIRLTDPTGVDWPIERGVQFPTPRSAEGCNGTTAANASTGHQIAVTPAPVPAGTPQGLYSTTIQITIAPAG